jgi:hypothetical protein
MEDADFMIIKDTGGARDLRKIKPKELQALVRGMYKDYEYHLGLYEDGFNPPVHRLDMALRELERARRNMSTYQRYLHLGGEGVPEALELAIEHYLRWISQGMGGGNDNPNFQDANDTLED